MNKEQKYINYNLYIQQKDGNNRGWNSLEQDQASPTTADDFARLHGASLKDEIEYIFERPDGSGVQGRLFKDGVVIPMPVERTNGGIDEYGWIAVGMQEIELKNEKNEKVKTPYYVTVRLPDEEQNRTLVKIIPADYQEEVIERHRSSVKV